MKKLFLLLTLSLFSLTITFGQDSLNVMFYNLFRFPSSPPSNREFLLGEILDSIQPDLLMACEIVNESGAKRIEQSSFANFTENYSMAEFVYSVAAAADPLQQMVYYNTKKLILLKQQTLPTTIRDINHYTFLLNLESLPEDSTFVEVFVTHLKSSQGPANRALRLGMIDTFVNALAKIPADHHVLLAGDFNFYQSANEPAYHKILDTTNHIVMVDPIDMPGKWHDNPAFAAIHTQATRTSAVGFGLGGATGGMDDRFDFIMMSEKSKDDLKFSYVEESYKAYGNNGNCFDKSIHDSSCTGIYSQELREKLHNMSDHTPVIMKFYTSESFNPAPSSVRHLNKEAFQFISGNVVSKELILKLKTGTPAGGVLTIYNLLGQVLWQQRFSSSQDVIKIDIAHLNAGMYFLKLENTDAKTLRFIKK